VKPIKFDTILTNPPVSVGMQIVLQIIKEAPTYLKKDGLLQLVVQSRIGGRRLVNELENRFGNVTVTSRKGGYRVLLSRKS
jgi:16S rRNA (guanine1207-N2)-methyltransferase